MRHPRERQQKLQRAGLSMGSDLLPNEIEAIDAISTDEAEHMTGTALRELIKKGGQMKGKREHPTIRSEALRILRAEGAMHYRDLADRIIAEGQAKPKGKTFKQTLSAELARNTHLYERVAAGVYTAKEASDA